MRARVEVRDRIWWDEEEGEEAGEGRKLLGNDRMRGSWLCRGH